MSGYMMYQVLKTDSHVGLKRGDVLDVRPGEDRDRFRIVREFEGMLERTLLVEHMEARPDAFLPLGDAPPLHTLLGIRRPAARKRARKPKLTLIR